MNDTKEIELKKPTFDYILNDLAFNSLIFRVVSGKGSSQDRFDLFYQVKLMQQKISRLRQNKARAIEYIKRCRDYHKTYHSEDKMFPDELTSLIIILEGSDKE